MSSESIRRAALALAVLAGGACADTTQAPGRRSAPAAEALTVSTKAAFAAGGNLEGGLHWDGDKLIRQKPFQSFSSLAGVANLPASASTRVYSQTVALGGYLYVLGGQVTNGSGPATPPVLFAPINPNGTLGGF